MQYYSVHRGSLECDMLLSDFAFIALLWIPSRMRD